MRDLPAALALLVLSGGGSASAWEGFRLSVRAGLMDMPGFGSGSCVPEVLMESGWLSGLSEVGSRRLAWLRNPADGICRPAGFYTGGNFTGLSRTMITRVTESGFSHGLSEFFLSGRPFFTLPWVSDGVSGRTTRAGLTGPDYTSLYGEELSGVWALTESGFAWGFSTRYHGTPSPRDVPWVMNVRTGAVFPAGLPGDAWGYGNGDLEPPIFTESGWLGGRSVIGGEPWNRSSQAVWVAEAVTGVTRRMGFFSESGYTGPGGAQYSDYEDLTESGWMAGISRRHMTDGASAGQAAWVGHAATGVVRRIGLFEGEDYTMAGSGAQFSQVRDLTESGWVAGSSWIYRGGSSPAGYAAWVADARTGAVRRVGLFQGEWPVGSGTDITSLTQSGWVCGRSWPNAEGSAAGYSAWVADAATGVTRPLGLTGGGFTSSEGRRDSTPRGITESGWVCGTSVDYRDGNGVITDWAKGSAVWVAHAATGEARPIGPTGPEFKDSGGEYGTESLELTEDGTIYAHSRLYPASGGVVLAPWVGDAATGRVTRLGLADGRDDEILAWTRSGFVRGVTDRIGSPVHWVADGRTGVVRRVDGDVRFLTEAGLAGGGKAGSAPGTYTAWVLDLKTGRSVDFVFQAPPPGGPVSSSLAGITPGGVAHGLYELPPTDSENGRRRPFLWMEGLGTLISDETTQGPGGPVDYDYLMEMKVNSRGDIAAMARLRGGRGVGVFHGRVSDLVSPGGGVQVTDLARMADGKFRLSFSTGAAVRITLQSSADLTIWADAQTVDAPAGARHMDIAPDPTAGPNHYWRLKTAPFAP